MNNARSKLLCRLVVALVGAVGLFACGCGSDRAATYPVKGKVVFTDGSPLEGGGSVEFESKPQEGMPINARGVIAAGGAFSLTTYEEGDGAVAGVHRAIVRPTRPIFEPEEGGTMPGPVINPRFEKYETSGLEFTVTEDDNDFTIKVERP